VKAEYYLPWEFDDGGRKAAGYKNCGTAGDCAARAIAIVTERSYRQICREINKWCAVEPRRRHHPQSSASWGVWKPTIKKYLESLEFIWVPAEKINGGRPMYLRAGELPPGRLVVDIHSHSTAVIDGVIRDTFDCARERGGGVVRCRVPRVRGYFYQPSERTKEAPSSACLNHTP
jgi:hypothetical protein